MLLDVCRQGDGLLESQAASPFTSAPRGRMLVASSLVLLKALVLGGTGASHFIGLLVDPAHPHFWFSHVISGLSPIRGDVVSVGGAAERLRGIVPML